MEVIPSQGGWQHGAYPKPERMVTVRRSQRARTEEVRSILRVMWSLSQAREDGVRGVGLSGGEGPTATS